VKKGRYKKCKDDLEVTVVSTKKYYCPFKLRGKPIGNSEGWVLKVICLTHNHDFYDIKI